MAFCLGQVENKLKIKHNLSNTEIELSYRLPTTEERIAYRNDQIKRIGENIEANTGAVRIENGISILTGIRTGDFEIIENGKKSIISSDTNDPAYRKDWKNVLKTYASDLIELLAVRVFDNSAQIIFESKNKDKFSEKN